MSSRESPRRRQGRRRGVALRAVLGVEGWHILADIPGKALIGRVPSSVLHVDIDPGHLVVGPRFVRLRMARLVHSRGVRADDL